MKSKAEGAKKKLNEDYRILESLVRDTYIRVVWSHKIQEKQSDIYARRFKLMETINVIAASITSAGVVSMIFTDPLWLKYLSMFLSFITVYITAYFKSFDLQKLITSHKAAANKLLTIRDQLMILLANIKLQNNPPQELLAKYEELIKLLDDIYQEVPSTTPKAVKLAGEALNIKKDNTFTDEEIDSFLPDSLKRGLNGR